MDRPTPTVADVFRQYGDSYRQHAGASLPVVHRRVMAAITACRTAALGGHVEQCDDCRYRRVWYNSCRNRHCPTCQSLARAAWIDARTADLLDTEYFHVVFTVPQAIAEIALQNKSVVYGILFRATAETLRTIAADPKHLGAAIGFFAVLHTWGQTLVRVAPASDAAGRVRREHPIRHQRMDVNIKIEGTPEALQDRHCAETAAPDAAPLRARPQPPAHRAQIHDDHRTAQRMVPRDEIPQPRRQREHPLADRDGGKHAVDEMRGALRHPPASTTRTEPPAFAGKRHQSIDAAGRTPKPRESAGQAAAREELPELALDELRQALALAALRDTCAKRLEVIADELVQDVPLGRARPVLRRGHGPVQRKAGANPTDPPGPCWSMSCGIGKV
jgi:hypothetical protein